jgi:hypothetical protein
MDKTNYEGIIGKVVVEGSWFLQSNVGNPKLRAVPRKISMNMTKNGHQFGRDSYRVHLE